MRSVCRDTRTHTYAHVCACMCAYVCVRVSRRFFYTHCVRTCVRHQRVPRCPHPKIVPRTAWARRAPSAWAGCRGLSRTRSTRPAALLDSETSFRERTRVIKTSWDCEFTVAAFMRNTLSACAADRARRGGASVTTDAANRHSALCPAVATQLSIFLVALPRTAETTSPLE
jgi:hypothetical protein